MFGSFQRGSGPCLGVWNRVSSVPERGLLHAQVLQFVHQCAAQLAEAGESAEMALQLFLTAAQSASEHARLEIIAYEFFEQVRWHYSPDKGGEHHRQGRGVLEAVMKLLCLQQFWMWYCWA